MQQNEAGYNTNLILTLCGELMGQAALLINMGLHPSEILIGYEKAGKKAMELLEGLTCHKLANARDLAELARCIKSVIASK